MQTASLVIAAVNCAVVLVVTIHSNNKGLVDTTNCRITRVMSASIVVVARRIRS